MTIERANAITYPGAVADVHAFLARPHTDEPRPAVIVIHEIFGLTEHTKDVAYRLSQQGYVTLAPHLYRGLIWLTF